VSDTENRDLSSFSMLELFQLEVASQRVTLTDNLIALERDPTDAAHLERLMRAAHSLKGAARMVNLQVAVSVAHEMEEVFVTAQRGQIVLAQGEIDLLLRGVDLLHRIAQTPEAEIDKWTGENGGEVTQFLASLSTAGRGGAPSAPAPAAETKKPGTPEAQEDESQRFLRVTAGNLNRLLGLASESLVESRWLNPFAQSLLRLKRQQAELAKNLDSLRETLTADDVSEQSQGHLLNAQNKLLQCRQFLSERLVELEMFDRRSANLSNRLYSEALACRMRPFADGLHGFRRMVRDLARDLGKQVKLEILGETTDVDRDILEKLEAPLTHLLRNAIDHGLENPAEREAAGKPLEGLLKLEARHSAGSLVINVTDDGRGIDLARLRASIVRKNLTTTEIADKLGEAELLEFLFLPGFTMKENVTEISGRGVGLDIVQNMIKTVRGSIRVINQFGKGTSFQLQLPLTLSVARTLLVEIAGEPYAFPLAHVTRTLKLPREKIEALEGRQHFNLDGQHVGLVSAHQIFGRAEPKMTEELAIVVVGDKASCYGLVTDRFLGERELVVQPLDPRLGKIKDISAGALMEDGSPVLIADVEDLVRSIEKLIQTGDLTRVQRQGGPTEARARKRILVVDDSLTVRELERKLLESRGYEIEVAVDGIDGWNAVRTGHFNLVVTDIDMPRMDGIELVTLIKKDSNLKSLPVLIVSYKDREEDRQRGLEAGADYYLTKGSFHDETLIQAVTDLIGEAGA
jgi:two-component system sensor histidine kinase and response regulator WspE